MADKLLSITLICTSYDNLKMVSNLLWINCLVSELYLYSSIIIVWNIILSRLEIVLRDYSISSRDSSTRLLEVNSNNKNEKNP